jgi:tRNA splicing ligase
MDDIKNLFLSDYDAKILTDVIEKNKWTIILCGSSILKFAEFCKNEFEKHYSQFPNEKISDILFIEKHIGNDNWEVDIKFVYTKNL